MRYNGLNFKQVIKAHEQWLKGNISTDAKIASCADFSNCNIDCLDFSKLLLDYANFINVYGVHADFTNTSCKGADFNGANLKFAYFDRAILISANFKDANLQYASMHQAITINCNISEAVNLPTMPLVCPEEGAFIGWKACKVGRGFGIAKLLIPEDAKRLSCTDRKCRCDKALVLEIQSLHDKQKLFTEARSMHDRSFKYKAGEMAISDGFDDNRWNECSEGIHFFITRQEALDYLIR